MFRRSLLLLVVACCGAGSGCAAGRPMAGGNPLFVAASNQEAVWERTVDVVHDYFEIEGPETPIIGSQPGVIRTRYKTGSSVFEPWHRDSHGLENRMESTLQSIRRRAFVTVTPAEGGYLIGVEVFKEIEDLPGVANNTAGGATFQQSNPLRRDLDLVTGQSTPSGWVILGRDELLEEDMIHRLQRAFSR